MRRSRHDATHDHRNTHASGPTIGSGYGDELTLRIGTIPECGAQEQINGGK
jgi:hypothetical protein